MQAGCSQRGRPSMQYSQPITSSVRQALLQPVVVFSRCSSRNLCRCSATNTGSNSFAQRAQEFAGTAQQRLHDFVQEQELDRKAAAASKAAQEKLSTAYQETEQNVRRTYMKIESEHNLSAKVNQTRRWLSERARDIDQKYSMRRKVKTAADDMKRLVPVWQRQFKEFSSTQFGKASLTLAFVVLLFSGLLWQLLNMFWLLWWVSVPVSLYAASQKRKETQNQAGYTSSNNPYGSSSSSWYNSSSSRSSSRGTGYNSDGPVVDAEWVSLDENDNPRSSSSSSRRWQ
eukprot:GHRR01001865.1.p1 GENE.GHRR01001865.1~~GHRR01001865.1.p1  ORF type:complete len:286 (+),score=109.27 GHRR01001865.1:158-1015(+)